MIGFINSIFEKRSASLHPSDPALASWFGAPSTASGKSVSPDTAMQVSTVFACVNRISQTLAMLPLHILRNLPDGGHEIARSHPMYRELHYRPNEWQTSYDWRMMMQTHVLLRGNAYSYIGRGSGRSFNDLTPLHPDRMQPWCITPTGVQYYLTEHSPTPPRGSRLVYRYFEPMGGIVELSPGEILHIRGISKNGIIGMNPIQLHREAVGLAMSTEEHGARLFSNGAQISKAFKHPGKLSDTAFDRLKTSLKSEYSGVSNAHKTIILEEGMDISTLSMTSEDAQFLETRKFQVEDIARIFAVPLVLIGHSGDKSSTYASAEQFVASFITHTMNPWFTAWEQAITRDILYPSEMLTYRAEFDVDAILRGDSQARSTYYQRMFQTGSMSPDEIRGKESLSPIPDGSGKKFYIMSNMIPTDMAGQVTKVPAKQGATDEG